MFDNKVPSKANIDLCAPTVNNPSFKFSKINGESDFHLMISKDQEDLYHKMANENADLKDALKLF